MKPKCILCLALVLGGNLFASEPETNNPPQIGLHGWEYIQYPWNIPNCPTFLIGWASGGTERSDEMSRGLRLDILNIGQGFAFFKTNAITARLYRANGEVAEPTALGKPLLNAPGSCDTMSWPGAEPSPQVLTYFPWGPNVLEEAWIEVTMGPERYWVEVPYGFDRNPAEPLAASNTNGPPQFIPAMKSLTQHDHVVHWENVHYNLGQTPAGGELSLIQSNPFDAVSDVDLYNYPKSQNVYSPHTDVNLLDADGTVMHGRCVNLHLDDNYLRRTDTFDVFDRGTDDRRCWGQIEISVDDKPYRVVVPSSLYKYVQGHAFKPSATDFLSKLNAGMKLEEVDMVSRNYIYDGIRNHPVSGHQYRYVFTPDTNEVTLQFDESDRLVSWNDKP
jgi:hypothetical protein